MSADPYEGLDQDLIDRVVASPTAFVNEVLPTEREPFGYQEEFLDCEKRKRVFVAGRQVGKSTSLSWLALHRFFTKPGSDILIFAPSNRQAKELFDQKLKQELGDWLDDPEEVGIKHVTKSEMHGRNGSRIIALPAANTSGTGETIRNYTADLIIADEAAFIDDDFYKSVLAPMLLTTQGDFVLAGTPWGQEGYFYEKWLNDRWAHFRVTSFESPLVSAEDLEEFQEDMTEVEYAREVLGEFVQKENAAFPEKIIKQCIYRGDEPGDFYPKREHGHVYMAVDPARHGDDFAVFLLMDANGNVFQVDRYGDTSLPEIEGKIRALNAEWDFATIIIDETGLGGGIVDSLKRDTRNVKGLEFSLQKKQAVYQSLRKAMEEAWVTIPDEDWCLRELRGMEREETPRGHLKFHAPSDGHDDFADALALAVWAVLGGSTTVRAPKSYSFADRVDEEEREGPRAYTFD